MSNLLLKSRPLVIIPELAVRLGVSEAIVLQQVQYWLNDTASGVEIDGRRWIYNTIDQWKEQFPFYSEKTIKRAFTNLKTLGVLNVEQLKKASHDRTNYYSINHEHPLLSDGVKMSSPNGSKCPHRAGQNDHVEEVSMNSSNGSDCPDLTETTTEITTENTTENSCPVPAEQDPAKEVLDYFNLTTNSNYRDGKTTMGHIRARLAENYLPSDLNLITDYLTEKWQNDSRMRDYLRPKTLFSPENCEEYFAKAQKWHESGRPACVNGHWLKPGEVHVEIDPLERDEAFARLISSGSKPRNRIEEIALKMAGKTGIRRQTEFMGRKTWIYIWKQATEQAAKEQEAA
ncbi:conserved phage C-terminal domain-containing protein [Morganella morganii subsp. morganii]|uniref:conserved phage C-terminal domain-containing protein n=1 Tax=Morganella morganii TaxID=582 RepID=UPI001BA42883|nr:conserved phage C-terminal domain-containing protein [Morganella morganii]MBT0511503.1 conserved phage C-terminal domain-containing protein [Morganella morganii subsp. morganii]HBC7444061.1 conserved phage C-terminal domain-containing protein [Morganella morganii]